MHNPNRDPAGVGIGIEIGLDGISLTSDVGEPTAVKLVKMGALRAFSVGISGAKIVKDARARGGRIVGGQIVEVSLVDRPANPDCAFNLVKMVGANSVWVADESTVEGDVESVVDAVEKSSTEVETEVEPVVEETPAVVDEPEAKTDNETEAVEEEADVDKVEDNGTPAPAPEDQHNDTRVEVERAEQTKADAGAPSEVSPSDSTPDLATPVAADIAVPITAPVVTPVEVTAPVVAESIASWAVRRLHDLACPAYSTMALKEVYPTLEKDGLSSALGQPARGMLYSLLSQEVGEDGGSGVEADDIHEIAKAYNALNEFLASEDREEITEATFALAAREELRKSAKIEDSADPGDAVRTKSGRTFYGEDVPLKSLHDALTSVYPSLCTLDVDKSVTADVTKAATVDVEHLVAERTQEFTTKFEAERLTQENETAELVKAHEAELVKLNEQIEELSKAPQLAVTTSGTQAPSRAVRGVQLNKSIAIEDLQKREQENALGQRILWLKGLAASGNSTDAYVAEEMLTKLGVTD